MVFEQAHVQVVGEAKVCVKPTGWGRDPGTKQPRLNLEGLQALLHRQPRLGLGAVQINRPQAIPGQEANPKALVQPPEGKVKAGFTSLLMQIVVVIPSADTVLLIGR
jgi:hypothetical protein